MPDVNTPSGEEDLERFVAAVREAVPEWIGDGVYFEVHDTMPPQYAASTTNLIVGVYPLNEENKPVTEDTIIHDEPESPVPFSPQAVLEAEERARESLALPHPDVSDEFWAEVPESDRQAFSTYLVKRERQRIREQALTDIATGLDIPRELLDAAPGTYSAFAGGWCAPSDSLFPEITVRRGGLAFTGGPRPLTDWSKKELRAEVERLRRDRETLQKALRKEQKRTRRLRRTIDRLVR